MQRSKAQARAAKIAERAGRGLITVSPLIWLTVLLVVPSCWYAFTPGGVELSVRRPRLDGGNALRPGDDVWLRWSVEAVHTYATQDETPNGSTPDSKQLPTVDQ
jgi:hypothetical protein